MNNIDCKDWIEFRTFLAKYSAKDKDRRNQWLFRGQSDSSWELITTLDQSKDFDNDVDRDLYVYDLLEEFRREAIRLGLQWSHLPNSEGFELLARHYGLPSPLMDWSESPYVAAYFAFEGALKAKSSHVAIYALDRTLLDMSDSDFEIIDDIELFRFNRRAWQQRGIFLRISTMERTAEEILDVGLHKFCIPTSERDYALADLEEMTINHTYLFQDPDGASRTASMRILG